MPLYREDYQAYGSELLDVMRRAAREAVQNDIDDVKRQQHALAVQEQHVQNRMVFSASAPLC